MRRDAAAAAAYEKSRLAFEKMVVAVPEAAAENRGTYQVHLLIN